MDRNDYGAGAGIIEKSCGPSNTGTLVGRPHSPQRLLDISKRIQQFVDDNGWSWCDLEQVYHILRACNK